MYLNIMFSQVIVAAKRQVTWTWVLASASVFNPLINLVLIPATESAYSNGAIGAAVSLLLTELVMVAAAWLMVGRKIFDRSAVRRCAMAIAASVAMWAAAYTARPLGTPLAVMAGVSTFLILVAALRIVTPKEVGLTWSLLGRRLGRRSA
jgi:hypothetical protein